MASYSYSAINAQALELTGEIIAPDLAGAREQLRLKGLLAESLREISGGGEGKPGVLKTSFSAKVKPKSLQVFSRQFATMIEAGLNVVGSLVILEQQTDDPALADGREGSCATDVEGGLLLSEAMRKHPRVFSRLYVAMVEAGEAAGILDIVLDRVAFQIEKQEAIRRRIKSAMVYPTMVIMLRDARAHRDAAVPRPDLPGHLRAAQRTAPAADAVRRRRVEPAEERAVGAPLHPARPLELLPLEAHGARPQAVGPLQAAHPDEDRRRRCAR